MMSTVTIKNKEIELKYTFNSFRYMGEIDFGELDQVDKKPFLVAKYLDTMLLGAVNHNPRIVVKHEDVSDYLEYCVSKDDFNMEDLFDELFKLLEKSNFFKSLQKNH